MKRSGTGNGKVCAARSIRCAAYTRKSTEEGLQQEFNSLDAQREAAEAYIASQLHEGWVCLPDRYDDGGFTGANMDRPALKRLFEDIEAGRIDCVVVYKVDRLSRSLLDFARMMEKFDRHKVSFVSVTQHFNTTHSMGRLTLNILLSFAQFEREIIGERTRDKIAAARRRGKWMGGKPLLGYDLVVGPGGGKLVVNDADASRVRAIFELYLENQSLIRTCRLLNERGWTTKRWTTRKGHETGGQAFDKTILFRLLTNVVYRGQVRHREAIFPGEHEAIIDEVTWTRAQQMLRSNGRTGGMHVRNKYGALLKGLLYCKPCGRPMMHAYSSKGARRYRYYTCYTAQKKGWHACPSKSIPAEQIDNFVVERIRAIGQDPTVMAMTLEHARSQDIEETAALENDIQVAEREASQIRTKITSRSTKAATKRRAAGGLAELQSRLGDVEQHLSELRDRAERSRQAIVTKGDVDAVLQAFTPLWDALSPREQVRALRLLIQRVEYDGAKGKITMTFHPNGIRTLGQTGGLENLEVAECQTA